MKTLDQYFPVMKDVPGRSFFVPSASINALAAVALLVGVMAYAVYYPTMKENDALQRLAQINDLIASSKATTQASINHLPVLVSGSPAFQSLAKNAAKTLQARLDPIKTVTVDQIRTAFQNRRGEYGQAQALITSSPFRGVPADQVPKTANGQAYLSALKVASPQRLEYQQIDTGTLDALSQYRAALDVQSTASKIEHQFDVGVNGDKSASAKTVLVPEDQSQLATQQLQAAPVVGAVGQSKNNPQLAAQTGAGQSDVQPLIAAEQQALPQVPAAQLAAQQAQQQKELAARQAQAAQERAAKQRELAQEQAKERAERAQQAALLKEQQAQQQAAQHAQQQQELAARQAQEAQQQAQQAAAEKARQCTSSLIARVTCASQGYNPITGQKSSS